jgi:hypothetical protein
MPFISTSYGQSFLSRNGSPLTRYHCSHNNIDGCSVLCPELNIKNIGVITMIIGKTAF